MSKHQLSITSCVPRDYSERAVSAAHDLLRDYQHVIAELRLITGSKGIFDVIVDGETLYSKHGTGRHADRKSVV